MYDGNFELLETDGNWKLVGTQGNWKETKKSWGRLFGILSSNGLIVSFYVFLSQLGMRRVGYSSPRLNKLKGSMFAKFVGSEILPLL
jgi:hypothetical protein